MNCDHYQRMLYLHRAGELSEQEETELRRHLQTCEHCAAERVRIETADSYIRRLRETGPTLRDPDHLATSILARITEAGRERLIDRFLDAMLTPVIRYASAIFVLAAVGSLLFQYYSTLDEVANLERRFAQGSQSQLVPGVVYSINSSTLRSLPDRKELQSLSVLEGYSESGDSFRITQRKLSSLVPFADLLSPATTSLLRTAGFNEKQIDAVVGFLQKNATFSFTFLKEGA
jgi:hypothetical protein